MIRATLFLTLFVAPFSYVLCQNTPIESSRAFKVYSNFNYESGSNRVSNDSLSQTYVNHRQSSSSFGYFTPAYTFRSTKGFWHEIELSRFQISQRDLEIIQYDDSSNLPLMTLGGVNTHVINLRLRYELNHLLFSKSKIHILVGLFFEPYYIRQRDLPKSSNRFSSTYSGLGANFGFNPRLTYDLGEKWFFDLNVPTRVIEIKHERNLIENPSFSVEERTENELTIWAFPSGFQCRFGFGYKI